MTVEGNAPEEIPSRRPGRRRSRVSIVGILGELLITAGVLVLLFLGWQLWLNDIIQGGIQTQDAESLSEQWAAAAPTTAPTAAPTATPASGPEGQTSTPVVGIAPGNAKKFAVLMVPRWGPHWQRTIAEGIGVTDVLNKIGLGHYPGTQMPGEVGNFAIASHRLAYGAGFKNLHELQVGDHIYVETQDGWYDYIYRSTEYVLPTGIGVIDPVPQMPNMSPKDRIITLTTCNPFYSTDERLIAYGVYNTWYPRAGGPPAAIAAAVAARDN